MDSNDSIFLGEDSFGVDAHTLFNKVFDDALNMVADQIEDTDPTIQAMISKSMTLLASTLVMNMELSPYVENYIKKIVKRAEKSYMKCGRVVSNAFLESSK